MKCLSFHSLFTPHFPLSSFSLAARGRGCQSSCAPHLGRSASTAKELWVSVSLHGNAWQPITILATRTQVAKALPLLLPLALIRKSLQWAAAQSPITTFQTRVSLQNKGYANNMFTQILVHTEHISQLHAFSELFGTNATLCIKKGNIDVILMLVQNDFFKQGQWSCFI